MKKEEFTETLTKAICGVVSIQVNDLMKQLLPHLENSSEEVLRKNEEIASLKARLEGVNSRIAETDFARKQAEEEAKSQKWVANELGKFVRDVANGLYEGHEIAAARRVYDLNSGTLAKKRINACNYDSVEAAKEAFNKTQPPDDSQSVQGYYSGFLKWLWTPAPNA